MRWGYEDWNFWIGACSRGAHAKRVSQYLFEYRKKSSSMLTQAQAHDTELKALIVQNNPSAYGPYPTAWSKNVQNNPSYAKHFGIEGRHFEWLVRLSDILPKPILIWGCGRAGKQALEYFQSIKIDISGFIDSDPKKSTGKLLRTARCPAFQRSSGKPLRYRRLHVRRRNRQGDRSNWHASRD